MIWWILLAVLVAGAALALRGRSASPSRRTPARAGSRVTGPALNAPARGKPASEAIDNYRGAMLFPQKDCCEAVLKLRGLTFAAPQIYLLALTTLHAALTSLQRAGAAVVEMDANRMLWRRT